MAGRREGKRKKQNELVDADIDPHYVIISLQFLPSAVPLSILDPCSLPYYPALINLLEKRAFSNGAVVRRGGALCRSGRYRNFPAHLRAFVAVRISRYLLSTISPQRIHRRSHSRLEEPPRFSQALRWALYCTDR